MKALTEVEDFGAIDADTDELLLQAFEDHAAYRDVLNQRRFLIVGRKGSGKTAIFKRLLTTSQSDFFAFGHTFSDYPWHHHDRQARVGIPDFDKFTHSWKYLILLTAAKVILNYDQSLPYNDEGLDVMSKIERFVIDTYGSRDPDVTQVFTPTKTLRLKPSFTIDWKILRAGISPESVPMEELPTIIQDVNRNLLDYILRCLNPNHEYFIAFDQLDLGFDPAIPDYANRLIGLLLACRDLNVAARQAGKKLFVVVFIRDDIYDTLHFEDKNKISENFRSIISWDLPSSKNTLKELMEKRFSVVLGDPDEHVTWEQVFDESREMPGRQTKYKHILDRTFLRPRDIIRLTNTILTEYKQRQQRNPRSEPLKFDNADINEARDSYSHYLLKELDDEIHKHLPRYMDYLELIKDIGFWQFEREDFERAYNAKRDNFPGTDADSILGELFEFSMIAFHKTGGRSGGSEYVFRYKTPQARFDPSAPRFRVHPGLLEELDIKRASATGYNEESDDGSIDI